MDVGSSSLNYQKSLQIKKAFNDYSNKMRDLRNRKFDVIVKYREKIDAVKLKRLWEDFERKYKNG